MPKVPHRPFTRGTRAVAAIVAAGAPAIDLEAGREDVRLKILSFGDVRERAAALRDGRADLAVLRPDMDLPTDGPALAILRDRAMLIVSPESTGIDAFPKLAGGGMEA